MRKINILVILLALTIFVSCKKDIQQDPVPDDNNTTESAVSENFNWNMQQVVTLTLTNAKDKFVVIAPVGSQEAYLKFKSTEEVFSTTLKMAKTVTQISINGTTVDIVNATVNFAMPHDFKSVATAQYALDFDYTQNDFVSTGDPAIDDYPFTMEAWIKTAGNGSDMAIMGYCSTISDEYQIGVFVNGSDGKVSIRSKKDVTNEEEKGSIVVTNDAWHHVAVVFVSANSARLYIDGQLDATETGTSPILPTEVNSFNIGRFGDNIPDSYFDGLIDEVRLWTTTRSQSQIISYRTQSVPAPFTNMAGYWKMEEGVGATTDNAQGNAALDGNLSSPDWIGNIDSDGDGAPNMMFGVVYDDYPHDATRAFNNYWPATPYTLAFEDLWPSIGDFDLNDAVITYRFNNVTNASDKLVETYGNFTVRATGGSLQKGFAFQLPSATILQNDFTVSAPGSQRTMSYITYNLNGTEAGQDKVVIIVDDLLPNNQNTISGTHWSEVNLWVRLNMVATDKSVDYFDVQTWNPFLIVFDIRTDIDRRREVHLAGYPPTTIAFNWVYPQFRYFDSANDGSNYPTGGIGGNLWYKTNPKTEMWGVNFGQYFPFGLDIPKSNFQWAIEADLTHAPAEPPDPDNGTYRFTLKYAYDYFDDWASSNGANNQDWYDHVTNALFIYSPTP